MKHSVLTFCMALLLLNNLCAQTTLTKQETISYIQKKLNEGLSHKYDKYFMVSQEISISECSITFKKNQQSGGENLGYSTTTYSDYKTYEMISKFDPRLILEISEESPTSGSLKSIRLKLNGASGTRTYWNYSYETKTATKWIHDNRYEGFGYNEYSTYYLLEKSPEIVESMTYISFYFLGTDPTNFNKLKKAFEHLKDLCEAEDDPFGN